MNFSRIPISFFPTSVLLIDDNPRFLKNISLELNEDCAYMLFDDPEKALRHLSTLEETRSLFNKYGSVNGDHNGVVNDQYSVNIELASIHKEIYNPERFKEVSVVVVDYAMPTMNGIQFCEQLSNSKSRIKKIMMTAEADHHIAVEAFNNGSIDKFILKSDLHLKQTLNNSIIELQKKFFYGLTESLSHSLEKEPGYCLEDPKIAEVFEQLYQKHHVVEHHLIDAAGSFLLLNASGVPSWFIIKTKSELEMYYDLALDSGVSESLCDEIRMGQQIPYFSNADSWHQLTGDDWEKYLYRASEIEGKETYYYAYLQKLKHNLQLESNIFSYQDYLNTLYAVNLKFLRKIA
jgi:CheY-like chemotaxis protein